MIDASTIQPTGDNVLIRRDSTPERLPSGVYVSDRRKHTLFGTVIAVGPGINAQPLRPGDRVAYGDHDTGVNDVPGSHGRLFITDAEWVFGKIEE